MRADWKEYTLEEITDKIVDCEHKTAPIQETGYPSIRTPNIGNGRLILDNVNRVSYETYKLFTKRAIPKFPDLIMAREAPLGNVAIIPNGLDVCLGQRTVLISPNINIVDPNFLCYRMNTEDMQHVIHSRGGGSTVPHLNVKEIRKLPITLPPLPTQRRIASILSAYDDLIENNLRRIALLEEMARQTYEEWFVRMRFPGWEEAEWDGELPKGWERKLIGDACSVSGGGTPSKAVTEYWETGDITWFSPTDLSKSNSLCVLDSESKITVLGLQKSSAKLLGTESFMMTSRATIGLFAIINKPFSTNQGFINVTPNHRFEKEYLLYNFITRIEEFKGYATGATFPELSKGVFKSLEIVWPRKEILVDFHTKIDILHNQLFNLTTQNRLLREARDILLPRLMSGVVEL